MANLIITVIAIALVASAALMSAYFAGDAFLTGSDEAAKSFCDNLFSQEAAAMILYRVNDPANAVPAVQSNLTNTSANHPNAYLGSTFYTDAPDDTVVGVNCAIHTNRFDTNPGFQLNAS